MFNVLAENERLAAKPTTIIPKITIICSLDEDPDQIKKWGNRLQAQKSLLLICVYTSRKACQVVIATTSPSPIGAKNPGRKVPK